ncbi:type 1 fimbrial protein (plasmid) [Pantoea dispersa]|uniref:fimbrial protein n=1 Tax=Pantoea dispersa TaxID=59814 RepID=UPI001CA6F3B1|nr:fimbrial protein [Pantoea dispersa]QZY92928.1 type 1 fimbrial protein [Pantoea dispersa]QZY92939.1 type 1 fimbrial protein [Pantoea dispersa]
MKLKFLPFGAALIALSPISPVMADDTGILTINASVADTTCVIKSEHLNQTINMTNIITADLAAASPGQVVGEEAFSFDIDSCPSSVSNVGVKFTYTPDAGDAQYLANTGTATGVLLGITETDDSRVNSGGTVWSSNFVPANGEGTVTAHVKAYRVGSVTPVAGDINSVATIALAMQ